MGEQGQMIHRPDYVWTLVDVLRDCQWTDMMEPNTTVCCNLLDLDGCEIPDSILVTPVGGLHFQNIRQPLQITLHSVITSCVALSKCSQKLIKFSFPSSSDILNFGSMVLQSHIESLVGKQICFNVKREINTLLNAQLSIMPS